MKFPRSFGASHPKESQYVTVGLALVAISTTARAQWLPDLFGDAQYTPSPHLNVDSSTPFRNSWSKRSTDGHLKTWASWATRFRRY